MWNAARPARTTILIALAVGIAAVAGDLSPQSFPDPLPVTFSARAQAVPAPPEAEAQPEGRVRQRRAPGRPPPIATLPGEAEGELPAGVTVFDDEYPGVGNLDVALLLELREAAVSAANDGIAFTVTSGWRSPELQDQLLREAVAEYGSMQEAARWVATPTTSAHVSRNAVDLGPAEATAWLSGHGARYGLCQIYGNEPWRLELRPEAATDGCPPMYADATHNPGLQP